MITADNKLEFELPYVADKIVNVRDVRAIFKQFPLVFFRVTVKFENGFVEFKTELVKVDTDSILDNNTFLLKFFYFASYYSGCGINIFGKCVYRDSSVVNDFAQYGVVEFIKFILNGFSSEHRRPYDSVGEIHFCVLFHINENITLFGDDDFAEF